MSDHKCNEKGYKRKCVNHIGADTQFTRDFIISVLYLKLETKNSTLCFMIFIAFYGLNALL